MPINWSNKRWDKAAKIWDADNGEELFTLRGHGEPVNLAAFSPDGQRVVTASEDGAAKIWDAENGRELLTLKGPHDYVSDAGAVFTPDGLRILALWDRDLPSTSTVWEALPWRDEDLPGDSGMSYEDRIQLYKLEQWKKRQKARAQSDDSLTTSAVSRRAE